MFTNLQEYFGLAELEVRVAKYCSTDLVRCRPALLRDRRLHTSDEDSVPVDELGKRVTYWITSTADPDRFHHSGVAELAYAERPIKQLQHQSKQQL